MQLKLPVVAAVETGTTAPDSTVDQAVAVALPTTVVLEIVPQLLLHRATMEARAAVQRETPVVRTTTPAVVVVEQAKQVIRVLPIPVARVVTESQ